MFADTQNSQISQTSLAIFKNLLFQVEGITLPDGSSAEIPDPQVFLERITKLSEESENRCKTEAQYTRKLEETLKHQVDTTVAVHQKLELRIGQLAERDVELDEIRSKLRKCKQELDSKRGKIKNLEQRLNSSEAEYAEAAQNLTDKNDELERTAERLKSADQELVLKDGEKNNVENLLTGKKAELKDLELRLKSAEEKLALKDATAEEKLAAVGEEKQKVENVLEEKKAKLEDLELRLKSAEEKLAVKDTAAEEKLAEPAEDVEEPGLKAAEENQFAQNEEETGRTTDNFAISTVDETKNALPHQASFELTKGVINLVSSVPEIFSSSALTTLDINTLKIQLNKQKNKQTNQQTWEICLAALRPDTSSSSALKEAEEADQLGPAGERAWKRCKERLSKCQEKLKLAEGDLKSSQQSNRLLNMEIQYYKTAFEKCLCTLAPERNAVKRRVQEQLGEQQNRAKKARYEQQKGRGGGWRR